MTRYLVCAGDGIGNVIQATPLIRYLALEGEVHCYTGGAPEETRDLLIGWHCKFASSKPTSFWGRSYDKVFCGFLSHPPKGLKKVGEYLKARHPIKAGISESESYLEMVDCLSTYSPAPFVETGVQLLPQVNLSIGICPGGKPTEQWKWKRYPRYGELALAISEGVNQPTTFHVVGTKSDDAVEIDPEEVDLYDHRSKLNLQSSASLLAGMDLVIANDCGMAHVAAAAGIPTIIIFGSTEVRKNLPPVNAHPIYRRDLECRPCQVKGKIPCEHECMQEIDPLFVAEMAKGIIQELS